MAAGRPFAIEKYETFLDMLRARPRSVREAANKLHIGERTVYTWLSLARDDGHEVTRTGFNPTRWQIT